MVLSEENVRDILKKVKYPGFSRDIISFGLVKEIAPQNDSCAVTMSLTTADPKMADQIKRESEEVLRQFGGFKHVTVTVNLQSATAPTFQPKRESGIKHSIAVASGKGGVGKSTVAVNLAIALSQLGHPQEGAGARVGLMDCDIYGPSTPLMMNVQTPPTTTNDKIDPIVSYGVKLISMGFLVDPASAVVWRGPMVTRTVQQFVHSVNWGELDYVVIDLPPGTGDIQLSLCQTLQLSGAVMVTTPQEVALIDVRKATAMFQKVNVPILGIIENMSYFLCPSDGKRYDIFGSGGGQKEATRLGVPLLGQIPIEMAIREGGDQGKPVMVADAKSGSGKAFLQAAETLRKKLP